MFKMNRKGSSIAFFILFIGAFALVFQAVFVQISFEEGINTNLDEYHQLDEEIIFNQRFADELLTSMIHQSSVKSEADRFEESFRKNMKEIAEARRSEIGSNLFLKLMNNEYSIKKIDGKDYIEINGLFVRTIVGNNEVKRNFNVTRVIE